MAYFPCRTPGWILGLLAAIFGSGGSLCGLPARACEPPAGPAATAAGLPSAVTAAAATRRTSEERLPLEQYRDRPDVRANLRYFLGPGRRQLERALSRGTPHLLSIRRMLQRERLPEELAWLPVIESGFSNDAVSRKGATGMWQFMPATARAYGLRVDRHVDERRDPRKATRAAIRHLRDLTDQFGSPFLAAAAYNAGAGKVDGGLQQLNVTDGENDDFFRLSRTGLLARETQEYVPRLIAAAIIAENPQRYGIRVTPVSSPDHDSVVVHSAVRLSRIARDLGVSLNTLRRMNPQIDGDITPAGRPTVLRYPSSPWRTARNLERLQAGWEAAARHVRAGPVPRRAAREGPTAERGGAGPDRRVIAGAGDTLASLAAAHGVPVGALRRHNHLAPEAVLRPGQVLLLPHAERDLAEREPE